MKKSALHFILFLSVFYSTACGKSNSPKVPEYANWPSHQMQKFTFLLNGEKVELRTNTSADVEENELSEVIVWNDVNDKPWLLIYRHLAYEPPPSKDEIYFFENKEGKWIFVDDLSGSTNKEILLFIADKYGLRQFE